MARRLQGFGITVGALLFAMILTFLIFGLPVGSSFRLIAEGAFSDKIAISRTLVAMTPMLLTGIGMTFAWRAGMYNIGGEGQFICGGLAGAALFQAMPSAPSWLLLLATCIGGMLIAVFAGWLQIKRGVPLVISPILLNFIALQFLDWACAGPLKDPVGGVPLSKRLPETSMLLRFDRQTDLHSGTVYALVIAVLAYIFLFLTPEGFRIRLVGQNARVARSNRMNPNQIQLGAMAISGALCGLAGGIEYVGISGQIGTSFSQNWGFLAIPVALLGSLHPLGVIASALYFGALFAGCNNLARYSSAQNSIIYIMQAVAVLIVVALGQWSRQRETKVHNE